MYVFAPDKLSQLMKKQNLEPGRLALLMSVSNASISYWINGRSKPTTKNIEQLTSVMNCSPNALFIKL